MPASIRGYGRTNLESDINYSTKLTERFWSKVEKTETCWNWIGSKTAAGYGQFFHMEGDGSKVYYAHRVSCEIDSGAIPAGKVIDHMCHNPACVRPSHLRAVTVKQNMENRRGPAANNRSSGILGVTWDKSRNAWNTQVGHNGKPYSAGRFANIGDAAAAIAALRNELFSCNDADRAA